MEGVLSLHVTQYEDFHMGFEGFPFILGWELTLICNLRCRHCGSSAGLSRDQELSTDEAIKICDQLPALLVQEVNFTGGEPLLRSDWPVIAAYLGQLEIKTKFLTNGIILDQKILQQMLELEVAGVGISLDGPKEIHDRYRRDRKGNGTFDQVMRGLKLLKEYQVEYNVLACVARDTAKRPFEAYRFFKEEGVEFIQFTPVVERLPDASTRDLGLRLAGPAALNRVEEHKEVTAWSVTPEGYGDFLIAVYEEWVRNDVGKTFVMNFEWALNAWIGNPSPVCIHAKQCGRSLVIEHNGDVYACDHCVYPQYRLGNILTGTLQDMAARSLKSGFGVTKETALPRRCRECDVLAACRGGCPKHRFTNTFDDEPGLHYLCEGYRKYFLHIRKYLRVMAQLLEHGQPVSLVMEALKGPLVITKGEGGGKFS